MHCYELNELKAGEVRTGLPLQLTDDEVSIPISVKEGLYIPVDEALARFIIKEVPPIAPLRLMRAGFSPTRGALFTDTRPDGRALIRLDLTVKEGVLHLTGRAYDEYLEGTRVRRQFHPFPCAGVAVIYPIDKQPWLEGTSHLEAAFEMRTGAGFRLVHAVAGRGQRIYRVSWNWLKLRVYAD